MAVFIRVKDLIANIGGETAFHGGFILITASWIASILAAVVTAKVKPPQVTRPVPVIAPALMDVKLDVL